MRKQMAFGLLMLSSGFSQLTYASDFNVPFYNTSGLGVLYADWATNTQDASAAYANPAALAHIKDSQMVFNAMQIFGDSHFRGTATTPPFPFPSPIIESGRASTDIQAFMPSFYLATPIRDDLTFGFHMTAPFALGTDYGNDSIVRFVSTRSQVLALDIGPDLGWQINDFISIGAGLDAVRLNFTLDSVYGPPLAQNTRLENNQNGWGYGWHGGILFNYHDQTKVGLGFHSRVSARTYGNSTIYYPTGGQLSIHDQTTKAALPARVELSGEQKITEKWTAMASVFYTHWETFNQINMENTLTPFSTTTSVVIPFNYHNTFDYSFGTSYQANQQWLFRAGFQILTTPSNDQNRGVSDPITSATIVAVGAQIKMNDAVKVDVGVGHSFFKKAPVNLTTPLSRLVGVNSTQTSLIGGQLTWTIV